MIAGRVVTTFERAHIGEINGALARVRATALERATLRQAQAITRGELQAADQWLIDYAGLLDGPMTPHDEKLARQVGAIAETA